MSLILPTLIPMAQNGCSYSCRSESRVIVLWRWCETSAPAMRRWRLSTAITFRPAWSGAKLCNFWSYKMHSASHVLPSVVCSDPSCCVPRSTCHQSYPGPFTLAIVVCSILNELFPVSSAAKSAFALELRPERISCALLMSTAQVGMGFRSEGSFVLLPRCY